MKRVIAIADRAALVSLKLLVALNALFFLSFLVVLLLAMGKAHAEAPVCAGSDLLSTLQKDDPVLCQDRDGSGGDAERQGPVVEAGEIRRTAVLPVRHHAHDRPARHNVAAGSTEGL